MDGIVAVFPLVSGVMVPIMCPFNLIVGGKHGVRGHTHTTAHAVVSDATQEVKNISFCC